MAINPNWPAVSYRWAPASNANGGGTPTYAWADLAGRPIGRVGASRGRQYETDQVQAGTLSTRLINNDGQLDPMNTASPWTGHIFPYVPYQACAQYPPTQNLLMQGAATGGDTGATVGTIGASLNVSTATDSSGGSIVASGSAFQGSNVLQFNVPANTAATPRNQARICYDADSAGVIPGKSFTVQMQVRNVTASTTLTVAPFFMWYDATLNGANATYVLGTSATLTGSPTAAWTAITLTATAPSSGVFGMGAGVILAATSPTSAVSVQVDAWQLEQGSSATAFTVPGITYPLYSGFTERWPSKWEFGGQYGVVDPTVVDAFALLSQRTLRDPLTEEIYSRGPRFLYTLADPQGSQSFADATGANRAVPVAVSKYGAGSLTAGNKITSASAGGTYTGATGTVVTIANQSPGTALAAAATYLSLGGAGITGPASSAWTRMVAFRYTGPTPASGANACLWSTMDGQRANDAPSGSRINLEIGSDGKPYVVIGGPTGAGGTYTAGGATNVCDGNWHMLLFGYSPANAQVMISQDGTYNAFYGSVPSSYTPSGIIADNVGGFVDASAGNGTTNNFQGDISYVCEWPFLFDSPAITAVYGAWKNSFQGDSTNQRYSRILGWAGYTGATDIGTGQTISMGAANVAGQDALSALASVVETENGIHYIARNGTITFRGRGTRYNALTPVYTFGENVGAGEWPYEEVDFDFDSTHLANLVTVTQTSTSQNFTAADATSQKAYFPRTMTRSVNSSSTLECLDAANYLLSRYKNPSTRVQSIKLHPSANPALWPVCLSLELNMRIRVMRRPLGAPPIQVDCFIEHIQWDLDDQKEAYVTLQCSPVDSTPYGLLGAWHTQLDQQYSATYYHVTFSASGSATNSIPVAAQVGVGQRITIDPGTSIAETLTVSSVPASSAGWTSGTIYFSTPTQYTHAAGAVICEALPTGVTDPTTYDASAKFDSAAFAY